MIYIFVPVPELSFLRPVEQSGQTNRLLFVFLFLVKTIPFVSLPEFYAMKKELDSKLQDFSIPQDSADETFENQEQIEISKNYEQLPKATLIATQEFIDDQLIYRGSNRDDLLK